MCSSIYKPYNMAEENVREQITDEKIDALNMPEAIKICRKHRINYKHESELYRIKYLIKYELLCKERTRKQVRGVSTFDFYYHTM